MLKKTALFSRDGFPYARYIVSLCKNHLPLVVLAGGILGALHRAGFHGLHLSQLGDRSEHRDFVLVGTL